MSDSFVTWYRSTPTAVPFASLVEQFGRDGVTLRRPGSELSHVVAATGDDVRLPAEWIGELVDHAVASLLVLFWLDAEFAVPCRFYFEGKFRQRLNFSTDGLPSRHLDTVARAVLRAAGDNLDERSAVIVDRDGRSAEFDWDTVVWRGADTVPAAPDVMLLPSATVERIAPSLRDVRCHEHAAGFTMCVRVPDQEE